MGADQKTSHGFQLGFIINNGKYLSISDPTGHENLFFLLPVQ